MEGEFTFKLMNFIKKHSLYEQGMQVRTFSTISNKWQAKAPTISYTESKRRLICKHEEDETNSFYQLSFKYSFDIPNDTTYFALSVPYTYSQLK